MVKYVTIVAAEQGPPEAESPIVRKDLELSAQLLSSNQKLKTGLYAVSFIAILSTICLYITWADARNSQIAESNHEPIALSSELIVKDNRHDQVHEFSRLEEFSNDRVSQFMVLPQYRLIACAIPKVGCSSLLALGKFLTDCQKKTYDCNRELSKKKLMDYLKDPSWTKMVFLREPTQRLLSGFLNKCDRSCCKDCINFPHAKEAPPFEKFLTRMRLQGIKGGDAQSKKDLGNAHFIPQALQCGGLEDTIGYYDWIGIITEPQTVYEQMLSTMKLSDKYQIKKFKNGVEQFYNIASDNDTYQNPNAFFGKDVKPAHTRTDQLMDEYYDETLMTMAEGLYADDIRLLKSLFTHPNATTQLKTFVQNYYH